jgi:hemolysin III
VAFVPAPVAGFTLTTYGEASDRHYPQRSVSGRRSIASSRAARIHGFGGGCAGAGGGAVSRRKRSTAATTAAASSGEAEGATISRRGRRLGTGVDHASARVASARMHAPEIKPRLRGVFHQWAFFVSVAAGALLVVLAPSGRAAAAGGLYAAALAGMFGASALYHRVAWRPALRPWFRRLDHSMIYVLIAGTCTPVAVLSLEGVLPVVVLAVLWGGALLGVVLKLVWLGAPRRLVAAVYLILGWVAVILLPEVVRSAGVPAATLFVAGGLLYTAGALVYARRRPDPRPAVFGFHEVFHVFVIAAAAAHFVAIALFVVPQG